MGILKKILNLFKTPDTKKNMPHGIPKTITPKLPELKKIGIDTPNCPYCGAELKKFPSRKTKCKNCGRYMYVRTRPLDYKKILLKESELSSLEEEWDKRSYINKKTKVNQSENTNKNNLVLDASDEMNAIIKDLIKHYQDYCNYDEMLRINKKDRLPILQYIWGKWMVHSSSIEKDLRYTYPQYDFKDLRLITHKEHKRIINIQKQKRAIEWFESSNKDFFFIQPFAAFSCSEEQNQWRKELGDNPSYEESSKNFSRHLCLIYDMHKISDVWYHPKGYLDSYFFSVFTSKIKPDDLKYYKFWVNGEIKQLNEQDFLNWCKSYNIDYPLYDEEKTWSSYFN